MSLRSTVAAVVIAACSGTAFAQNVQVIVAFNGPVNEKVVTDAGGSIVLSVPASQFLVAKIPPGQAAKIAQDAGVECVQEDRDVQLQSVSLGQLGTQGRLQAGQYLQWGVQRIGAPQAWSATRGAGVRVAIVDSGIDASHPDFKDANGVSCVVEGRDFIHKNTDASDDHGHGTFVAGVVGARDNGVGVIGVAPECSLVAVKVLTRKGSGGIGVTAAGIDWAADHADVINLSIGSTSRSAADRNAINRALAKGVVVVAAAGNYADVGNPVFYPAAYPGVIAVGATDSGDHVAFWSERGDYLDLGAPGVGVVSPWPGNLYAIGDGTSFACPHAVGVAALLRASGVAAADVRARMESTADDINAATLPGKDIEIGNGLVDAEEAVTGNQTHP